MQHLFFKYFIQRKTCSACLQFTQSDRILDLDFETYAHRYYTINTYSRLYSKYNTEKRMICTLLIHTLSHNTSKAIIISCKNRFLLFIVSLTVYGYNWDKIQLEVHIHKQTHIHTRRITNYPEWEYSNWIRNNNMSNNDKQNIIYINFLESMQVFLCV